MSAEDTNALIEQRRAKLASLREHGIDPFANKFTPSETCADSREKYEENRVVSLAGRVSARREMGKSLFIDIKDQTGRMQVYVQKKVVGDELFKILEHIDLGDFIGVTGAQFTTKMGEISVKLESFKILAKALRPPPSQYYGLEDTETRYRQRYLDLIANDDVKDVFLKRSQIIHEIRQFFYERKYVEVETPVMQAIPGGAAAQPFITKHNALGCDFYLRIALELYHKRLLVGGIDRLFEIGKNFRNEGLSRRHNPEFTMLEAYQAFGDYETMMETVESLITTVAQKVLRKRVIEHHQPVATKQAIAAFEMKLVGAGIKLFPGDSCQAAYEKVVQPFITEFEQLLAAPEKPFVVATESVSVANRAIDSLVDALKNPTLPKAYDPKLHAEILNGLRGQLVQLRAFTDPRIIDLVRPWKRARYKDLVKEVAGADWFDVSSEERRRRAIEDLKLGGDIATGYEDFEVTGAVFEKLIEPTLIQPTFVTHLPKELVPLAKLSPDDPSTVEVFECCINGQEISPGYTEQNDPVAQRATLEHQAGGEQQKLDEDFLIALEHGMPPAGGISIGIDRLCMMLLGQESIRDVILFPQLKPR